MEEAAFYRSGKEHLADELRWLDVSLSALLKAGGGKPLANPSMQGLVVRADELRLPSEEQSGSEAAADVWGDAVVFRQRMERAIAARAEAAMAAGVRLPLAELCSRLRLTVWERRCVVLCLAAEASRQYEQWFGYLNDDVTCKWPTLDLAARLLADSPESGFETAQRSLGGSRPLRGVLLEPDEQSDSHASIRPRLKSPLRLDARTVSFLFGSETIDARIAGIAAAFERPSAGQSLPTLPPGDPAAERLRPLVPQTGSATAASTTTARAAATAGANVASTDRSGPAAVPDLARERLQPLAFVHLWGPRGGGKRLRLRHLAAARGQRLLVARLSALPEESDRAAAALARLVREALLTNAVLGFAEENGAPGADVRHAALLREALRTYAAFAREPLIAWTATTRRQSSELPLPEGAVWLDAEVPVPSAAVREAFWMAELSQLPAPENGSDGNARDGLPASLPRELADKYRFTPGQIADAWLQASALAASRDGLPTPEELDAASRRQFRHRLTQLADRIEPARTWSDLVLHEEPLSLLKEACSRFRHRETVFERWGFGRKLPYGRGLSMLFAGPPGTGKTMSAEIVAADLGLELYRIDLSRIVSKYIGETEQRLSELFAEAEHSGAILFFDEGDALFGKRTEVKDAHDKYANLEAAYLLQRIEAYDGVSILATNLLQNLDEALLRRMSFIVKFPFPDAAERELIFRTFLPPEAPLDERLDLGFLASRLEVSGGYIKNIVLAAAFLAASEREPIGMGHLVRASRQELRKMGKILVKETFSPYFDD